MRRSSMLALLALVLFLGIGLAVVGCGSPQVQLEPGTVLWGEVSSIDDHELHLTVGSMEDGAFTAGTESVSVPAADTLVASDAGEDLTTADLVVGDVVQVTMGEDGAIEVLLSRPSEVVAKAQGEAAVVIDGDDTRIDATFKSSDEDESALRVEGGTGTFVDCKVEKSGDPSDVTWADNFGLDAAVLLRSGGHGVFDGGSIATSAQGGASVFAYGATATLNKTQVTTTRNDSSALVATSSGTIESNGSSIATSGITSPALRTSGGGTARIAGGELVTSGYDAPVVASTANVSAEGTKLTAAHSEMLVLEGSSNATFANCSMAGSMDANRGSHAAVNVQGILLYQEGRMHGDPISLSLTRGSLTNNAGDLIYVTNNRADIRLEAVSVQNADPKAALLRVAGNDGALGWGEAGANGGQATLTCVGQRLEGDIVVDRISTLALNLTEGSELTGAITCDAREDDDGEAVVTVEEGSTWRLTDDSKITSLENHGTVIFDGHTLTLADGSVLGG